MFYRQILDGASPYAVNLTALGDFGEHRHGDVEINYCIEGSFNVIIDKKRIEAACHLLSETNLSIAEIAGRAGLCEPKTFCRVFRSIKGITPGTYRKEAVKARSASS